MDVESVAEVADHDLRRLSPLVVGQLGLGGHRRLVAASVGPLLVVDDDGVGALAAPVDDGDLVLDLDGDELAGKSPLRSTDVQFDALALGAAHCFGADLDRALVVGVVRLGREGDDTLLAGRWGASSSVSARTSGHSGSGYARHQDLLPRNTHGDYYNI